MRSSGSDQRGMEAEVRIQGAVEVGPKTAQDRCSCVGLAWLAARGVGEAGHRLHARAQMHRTQFI